MTQNSYDLTDEKTTDFDEVPEATKPASAPKKAATVLDGLRDRLSKDVTRPDVNVPILDREGVELIVNPNIDQKYELHVWRKKAGFGVKGREPDTLYYAALVIASKTVGIMFDGEEAFSEDGVNLTFASPEIKEMLGVTDPVREAVKAMIGPDPHIEATASAILEAAGYGDEVEVSNPTTTS